MQLTSHVVVCHQQALMKALCLNVVNIEGRLSHGEAPLELHHYRDQDNNRRVRRGQLEGPRWCTDNPTFDTTLNKARDVK